MHKRVSRGSPIDSCENRVIVWSHLKWNSKCSIAVQYLLMWRFTTAAAAAASPTTTTAAAATTTTAILNSGNKG